MCMALPGKIIKIENNQAVIQFNGHKHTAKLDLIKKIKIGDYVYTHDDYVLDKISQKEAEKILNLVKTV